MKLTLNTTDKVITIEEKVNLGELIEALKKLLPNNEWKSFKLETNNTIHWASSPIIVQPYIPSWTPFVQPWYHTRPYEVYCGTGTAGNSNVCTTDSSATINANLQKGIYNLEIRN